MKYFAKVIVATAGITAILFSASAASSLKKQTKRSGEVISADFGMTAQQTRHFTRDRKQMLEWYKAMQEKGKSSSKGRSRSYSSMNSFRNLRAKR